MSPPRVLIVEDHDVLSHSLAVALRGVGFEVAIAEGWTEDELVTTVTAWRPDVTLLDLHLGEQETTLPTIPALIEGGTRVVVLTASAERAHLAEAMRLGATAAMQKSAPFDLVVETIHAAVEGRDALGATRRAELLDELVRSEHAHRPLLDRFAGLTGREQAVLAQLVDGRTPGEIAEAEFVAVSTVRSQLKSIYRKLGVNSQLAAVALARRAGWALK